MKKENTSDRLKKIMIERNLRQTDLLKLCEKYCQEFGVKLNKNDLSQYVSGKVTPGQKKLTILAKALDVPEAWLMGFDIDRKMQLSNEEVKLLEAYRGTSPEGRKSIIKYMEFLLSQK